MNYKKSMFNVEIDKLQDNRVLLYNTYTGIFGIMDTKTQEIYNEIEDKDISGIDDEELRNNISIMLKSGYIVDIDKDELSSFKVERMKFR